jgi:hypothetical protein
VTSIWFILRLRFSPYEGEGLAGYLVKSVVGEDEL